MSDMEMIVNLWEIRALILKSPNKSLLLKDGEIFKNWPFKQKITNSEELKSFYDDSVKQQKKDSDAELKKLTKKIKGNLSKENLTAREDIQLKLDVQKFESLGGNMEDLAK